MDLSRYQSLLTAIATELSSIGDANGAHSFEQWLQTLQEPSPALTLRTQLAEVQRSARSIVSAAIEHHLWPSVGGFLKQTDLESSLDQLLTEAANIADRLPAEDSGNHR